MTGTTVWITGLPGSGKSTLAGALVQELGRAFLVDADEVRKGLNVDLDFSRKGRAENVRRLGEVSLLLTQAGYISVVACISPFSEDRRLVRRRHDENRVPFLEVYLSTPRSVCECRDPKRLYRLARAGLINNLPGVSVDYEVPEEPNIAIDTSEIGLDDAVDSLIKLIGKQAANYAISHELPKEGTESVLESIGPRL